MKATKNAHDWHCETHDTYGWRGDSCKQCPINSDAEKSKRDLIMRQICESEPADPDHERTVCINYERLYQIVSDAILGHSDDSVEIPYPEGCKLCNVATGCDGSC